MTGVFVAARGVRVQRCEGGGVRVCEEVGV